MFGAPKMGIHPSTWEVVMLKQSLMLAAATTILAACGAENPTAPATARLSPSSARAAAVAHQDPGTPGTAGCRGQTIAYIAQLARAEGVPGANGLGGVARFDEMSVKDIQALADAYCAGEV
jgi:hypothetical protein